MESNIEEKDGITSKIIKMLISLDEYFAIRIILGIFAYKTTILKNKCLYWCPLKMKTA